MEGHILPPPVIRDSIANIDRSSSLSLETAKQMDADDHIITT